MKLNAKEIKAKLEALSALLDESNMMDSDELKEGFDGLKKVTVASDSPEGLKEGLDKAEDIIEAKDEDMKEMLSPEESAMELPKAMGAEKDLEVDEDLKKPIKAMIKSKKAPKLNFFE